MFLVKKTKTKERKLTYTDLTFVLFILEETLCVVTVGVPSTKTSLVVSWQVISQILCTDWILLLGSVTNETLKIYNKKTVTIQFGYDFFSDKRIIQVLCPLAVDKRLWINSYGRLYQSIPLYVRGKEKEVSLKL